MARVARTARSAPVVRDGVLTFVVEGSAVHRIKVGGPDWWAWLARDDTVRFRFDAGPLRFTAHRKQQKGESYWYATGRHEGRLREITLGTAADLTLERLQSAAEMLAHPVEENVAVRKNAALVSHGSSASSPSVTHPSPRRVSAAVAAQDLQDALTTTSPQSVPLLATKLFIPRLRSDAVPRARLVDRVEVGIHGPLTLLAAPAGWGKTAVLSAWQADATAAGTLPIAWVTLDAGDNDPVRFWTYVLTALNAAQAGVADAALTLLRSPQPPPIESILTPLLNAVAAAPTDIVLVLDDYHVIETALVHNALAFLLDHPPPQLHLVLSTREDPPLPLARLRAQGSVTELRTADLSFTAEETAAFLAATLGITLPTEAIAALEAHSEGWIAGLQLAVLSVQGRSPAQVEAFLTAFIGSNRYIVDYLAEEVLGQQPAALQTFLLRTAVLDRLCAPLCERLLLAGSEASDDVLGGSFAPHGRPGPSGPIGAPPRSVAQALLEQAEQANLFLIPLDDERRWYRYHHLFADVLRSRLRQADPELYQELQRQASVWYEEQGLVEEAVQYALAATDVLRATVLIERHGLSLGEAGHVETVLGWLQALPEGHVRSQPILCACHATILFLSGAAAAAVEVRLRDAEAAVEAHRRAGAAEEELRPIVGMLALVRALVAVLPGDVRASASSAREALALLPEADSVWCAIGRVLLDQSYELTGDVTDARERALGEDIAAARAAGNLQLAQAGLMDLGHVQRLQGRLRAAAATYEEAMRAIPAPLELEDLFNGPGCAFGLGEVRLEWNDLDEAERLLTRGVRMLVRWAVPARTVTMGYLALARLRQARGDPTGALATLDAFAEMTERRRFAPEWVMRGTAMRAQLQLAQGDLAAAIGWADGCGLSSDDVELSFLLEPAYLALVRVRITQGRTEPASSYLVEVLRLLDRLQAGAAAKGRGRSVLEMLILRALALRARRDTRGAVRKLAQALEQAQPEGYVRRFADESAPMAALLTDVIAAAQQRQLAVPEALLGYAHVLLAACHSEGGGMPASESVRSPHPPTDTPSLLDPLTAREIEVLRLLAEGAPNAAIAAALVVTVGTVKKHVANLCAKLGVQNRTQAVARARALHLV
jgi:LuxR family maltose regulon positive regulatory protein